MRAYGWWFLALCVLPACSSGSSGGGPLDGGVSGGGGAAGAGSGGAGPGTGGAGGGTGFSCDSFTPCGGSIAGTWNVTQICGFGPNDPQPIMNCPGGTVTADLMVSGTLSFAADGSYTTTLTQTGTAVEKIPKSCLGTLGCDAIQDALRGSSLIAAATCVDDGTNCNCNLTYAPTPNTATGTYTVSGGTLTTTPSSTGTTADSRYCVSGNQLGIAPADPQSKIIIVATK